jgi:ABC-type transport system involved in multi-copper enzyme maturation permease subunit
LATGDQTPTATIPITNAADFDELSLDFPVIGKELSLFKVESDQPIFIGKVVEDQTTDTMIEVLPGNSYEWIRGKESISPIGDEPVAKLAVTNMGGTDATIKITIGTKPVYPQSKAIFVTALSVVGVFLLYFLQQAIFPKMSAIALSTCKSEMLQPLFIIVLGLGAFLLFIFLFIPYNTFGEDIKMLKDSGFTTIMVLAIIHAVWGASNSVAEEIEGKTALTVLSKPVSRRQFVFGKFIGISWSVAVLFIVLGAFFMILIAYKPVYDARESAKLPPIWEESYVEVVRTTPGLVLAFLETVVMTSISVAISTRLPLLANFAICFAVYTLGHLTPLLVQSAVGNLPPVAFMGIFISAVLPVLEAFNIQAAVAAGREVPYTYLGWAVVYCCLYSSVAMLLALILFEDRDLA